MAPSHPNRSGSGPSRNPTADQIRLARLTAGLTQKAAADLIHATERAWQEWEAGNRRMHPGLWELYQLKTHMWQGRALRVGQGTPRSCDQDADCQSPLSQ